MKYKIDFNNGKVFEAEKDALGFYCFNNINMSKGALELLGATITEIKEPIKFECDVEWCSLSGFGVYPSIINNLDFNNLFGRKGRLVFTEHEE
jgi:hypothetical protein